jgi:hypothetical protein
MLCGQQERHICNSCSSKGGGVQFRLPLLELLQSSGPMVSRSWGSASLHPRLSIFSAFGARPGGQPFLLYSFHSRVRRSHDVLFRLLPMSRLASAPERASGIQPSAESARQIQPLAAPWALQTTPSRAITLD